MWYFKASGAKTGESTRRKDHNDCLSYVKKYAIFAMPLVSTYMFIKNIFLF